MLVLVLARLVLVWLLLVLVNLRPHYFSWCTDKKRSLTNQWLVRRVLSVSWLVISSTLLASIASHTSTSNVDRPLGTAPDRSAWFQGRHTVHETDCLHLSFLRGIKVRFTSLRIELDFLTIAKVAEQISTNPVAINWVPFQRTALVIIVTGSTRASCAARLTFPNPAVQQTERSPFCFERHYHTNGSSEWYSLGLWSSDSYWSAAQLSWQWKNQVLFLRSEANLDIS
jgi:hypothetical protein